MKVSQIKFGSPTHRVMQLGADNALILRGGHPGEATRTQLRSLERANLARLNRRGVEISGGYLNANGLAKLAELDAAEAREARLVELRKIV